MPVIKTTLKEFAENTSAHGVNKLVTSKGWFIKLIWLVLFLGASSMIVYQVSRLVVNYLRRPATAKTTVVNKPLLFPSVTICNLNPVRYSKVKTDPALIELVGNLAKKMNMSLDAFPYDGTNEPPDPTYPEPANTTVEQILEEYSADFLMQLNAAGEKIVKSYSQKLESLLVSCSFAGKPCSADDFTTISNFDYGICYQFPNATNFPNGVLFHNAGPLFGFRLVLNIDQNEYIPFLTPGAGIRVRIHEINSSANLLEQGHSIPAGFETSIGVRPVVTVNLPAPFGTCDETNAFSDILGCQRDCLESAITRKCQCSRLISWELAFEANGEDSGSQSNQPCEKQHIGCIKEVIKRNQEGIIVCGCIHPCRKHTYEMKTSMTRYPSTHYDPALRYTLSQWIDQGKIYSVEESRKNILSLKVYFSDLEEKTIEEEEAYPFENLLSDIGGQLGLWLGISVFSVCEVVELLYLIIHNSLRGKKTQVLAFSSPE
ncbi:degenerin-like protein asic-1 [Gigantopelta aegis]|uniref:degenerin-like protein asic-1 n=1 Tax=Gigantopelta aegis TaxID=1735272 RepID=UPI001B88C0B9|nr:degenerin-like protein asic-1 [Gigantopelta aegis]